MSLYWFAGYLDQTYTINPVRLRGYDAAGNLLYAVRDNAIRDHDLSALAGSTTALLNQQADFADPYRFVAGWDEWGDSKTLTTSGWFGFELPQRQAAIRSIAVDSDGWIYCAMEHTSAYQLKSGATESQMRSMREMAVSEGVGNGVYHSWGALRIYPPYDRYYDDLVAYYTEPASRYDRLYVDFVRVYRQNGDRIPFPELHGRPVYAVATDDTYFYLAGEAVGAGKEYLRKYDKTGTQQWAAEQPAWMGDEPARYVPASTIFGVYVAEYWVFEYRLIHNIIVDGSGNLYLSGHNSSSTTTLSGTTSHQAWLRKYNSSGVLQWERRFTLFGITNVVTDGTLIYVAFYRTMSSGAPALPNTYRIDTTDYFFDVGEGPVEIVAWDADGDIVRTTTRATTLYNGAYQLDAPQTGARRLEYHDGLLYLSVVSTGDPSAARVLVYDTTDLSETTDAMTPAQYAGLSDASGVTTILFDATGARIFPVVSRASPASYTDSASQLISYPTVARHYHRYDDAGTQLWTDRTVLGWEYPADLPSHTYTEAWTPNGWPIATAMAIVATPALPAVMLPISLGITTWEGDRYTECPGLPFRLALAVPGWLREYVGTVRLPDVYRLILAGDPPLEFAVSSLTLRRTAFSRKLTAVVHPPGVEALALVEARLGDTLTLYRGVRFGDGVEQLEVMMEVPLATVRSDRGARAFSITVEGRAEEAENVPHTRTLTGVSYRASSTQGQRRVRCTIDTYLKPGYTAIFGANSMIVGEITISISPSSGMMEVSEVSA